MIKTFNGVLRLDYYGYKIHTMDEKIFNLSKELEYIYMTNTKSISITIESEIKQEFFERGEIYKDKNELGTYVLHINDVDLNSRLLKLVGNLILISIEMR